MSYHLGYFPQFPEISKFFSWLMFFSLWYLDLNFNFFILRCIFDFRLLFSYKVVAHIDISDFSLHSVFLFLSFADYYSLLFQLPHLLFFCTVLLELWFFLFNIFAWFFWFILLYSIFLFFLFHVVEIWLSLLSFFSLLMLTLTCLDFN